MEDLERLRFPFGRFQSADHYTEEERNSNIKVLEQLTSVLEKIVLQIGRENLDISYRPGGWNARQVIHHIADSHMNAYIRLKWTLTEDTPTIKPYDQEKWSALPDSLSAPIEASLLLLKGVHTRFVLLLRSLKPEDFSKAFYHPENKRHITIEQLIALYAWHGRHHCAHLEIIAKK
jgi:hypothetical protein